MSLSLSAEDECGCPDALCLESSDRREELRSSESDNELEEDKERLDEDDLEKEEEESAPERLSGETSR